MWSFIQDQILGMKWLNELIGEVLTNLGLDMTSKLGGSLQFFIYDVLKNYNITLRVDFYNFLYTKLFPT